MADNAMISLSSSSKHREASEDDDNEAKRAGTAAGIMVAAESSSSGKKPRGRPPGSKNKPKPPIVITKESDYAMHPLVLEIAAGCDIVAAVSAFARRRRVGISVLSGGGAVSNVALRHPGVPGATITLHGRFDILSLSGTFLPPTPNEAAARTSAFTISLAGAQGQVIGGTVAGALTAAVAVVLVVATFVSSEFHRLPEAVEEVEVQEELMKDHQDDVKSMGGGEMQVCVPPPSTVSPPQHTHEMVLWGSARAPPPHLGHATPPSHY